MGHTHAQQFWLDMCDDGVQAMLYEVFVHDKILEPIGGSSYLACYEDYEENVTKWGTQTLQINIHEKCGGYHKGHIRPSYNIEKVYG
jgi:hypothetical protein